MQTARWPLAAILLSSAGCTTLQPVPEPFEFIQRANPQVVYVTFKNQSKVTLTRPRVSGDSLFGTVLGVSHQLAAPLSHVQGVEAVQPNRRRTTWLVVGLTTFTVASVFMIALGGEGGRFGPCDLATDECDPTTEP